MSSFDAIVVGAGPAGSTIADRLKKKGFDVKLLDKKIFPRVKPCAGWVTPQVIQCLQIDVEEFGKENTIQPITGFRTGVIDGKLVETRFDHVVSYGIRRVEFDDYLLKRSGVNCEFEAVKQIERENGAWRINEKWVAPILIGAGGHFCPVARHVRTCENSNDSCKINEGRSKSKSMPVVYAQEVEFEMSAEQQADVRLNPELPELYFCRDMLGYGWCFRKGRHLNVGLGRLDKVELAKHVHDFWEFLRKQEKVHEPCPQNFLGHAYQLYAEESPTLFANGILLIGDAAGLAYAHSGEGIRPAVESAIIAADVVANANGDYRAESLSTYQNNMIKWFGQPKPYRAASWLPASWLQSVAARLMATHWFAKKIVVERWFLNSRQGALSV